MSALTTLDAAARSAEPSSLGDEAFGELTSPFRRELLVHCYRMLGSIDDAEDAVQDTLARAWRGRATFREAISLRAWLYRIATNACLDAIERRRRGSGGVEPTVVEPVPENLLDEPSAGPEARYEARESVSLAFLTALQLLTPRQRGVLILRDVLGWHADEVATLLELSVPAANSALHRARTTLARRYSPTDMNARHARAEPGPLRALLDRYVRAWEAADIPGIVALLREDAIVSMPPGVTVVGAEAIARFLAGSVFVGGRRIRLSPIETNGGPGYVLYSGPASAPALTAYSVVVVGVNDAGGSEGVEPSVSGLTVFTDRRVVDRFPAPKELAPA